MVTRESAIKQSKKSLLMGGGIGSCTAAKTRSASQDGPLGLSDVCSLTQRASAWLNLKIVFANSTRKKN